MNKNLIYELNKILTNTLDYREVLLKLAESVSHQATQDKLEEFAKVRKKQSEDLILLISNLGGNVQSTERQTDQPAISWTEKKHPDDKDIKGLLEYLIGAEENSVEDYSDVLKKVDDASDAQEILERHKREGETTLNYLETALETNKHSN